MRNLAGALKAGDVIGKAFDGSGWRMVSRDALIEITPTENHLCDPEDYRIIVASLKSRINGNHPRSDANTEFL
jgi:hypothetical protein